MKKQILFRKCWEKNGKYYSNLSQFEYPKEGWVEAKDWNPKPKCMGGLHALRVGDVLGYLVGDTWQIFTDYEDLVVIDDDHVKVRKAYVISDIDISKCKEEFLKYPYWAYYYAAFVKRKPSKETRDAACNTSHLAYCYALNADKKPLKQTREAARKDPYWRNEYYYWELYWKECTPSLGKVD